MWRRKCQLTHIGALDSDLFKQFLPASVWQRRLSTQISERQQKGRFLPPSLFWWIFKSPGRQPAVLHARSFQLGIACVIIICMDCTLLKLDLCDCLQLCMDLRLFRVERPTIQQWDRDAQQNIQSGNVFTHNVWKILLQKIFLTKFHLPIHHSLVR